MRKIEEKMLDALRNQRTWYEGNTAVFAYNPMELSNSCAHVFLHGHLIAWVYLPEMEATPNLATIIRFPTNTTISRLKALGVDVCRKKGKIYLNGKEF